MHACSRCPPWRQVWQTHDFAWNTLVLTLTSKTKGINILAHHGICFSCIFGHAIHIFTSPLCRRKKIIMQTYKYNNNSVIIKHLISIISDHGHSSWFDWKIWGNTVGYIIKGILINAKVHWKLLKVNRISEGLIH